MKRGIEESSLRSLCFEATVRERGKLERSVCSVCAFSPIKEGGVNPRVRVCVFEEGGRGLQLAHACGDQCWIFI